MEQDVNADKGRDAVTQKQASFWISRTSIDLLLRNQASVLQIGAFLTIASFTDRRGIYSTCGYTAISEKLGINKNKAKSIVDSLVQIKNEDGQLLYTAEQWQDETGEIFDPSPTKRSEIRFIVNNFDEVGSDAVWFGRSLVQGIGSFKYPLKKLRSCGDIASRLLLLLYANDSMEDHGGINPTTTFRSIYNIECVKENFFGSDIYLAKEKNQSTNEAVMQKVLGVSGKQKIPQELADIFWKGFKALLGTGFIYQVISVSDRNFTDPDLQILYEITSLNRFSQPVKGEEGIGELLSEIADLADCSVKDSLGRHFGKRAVLIQTGLIPYVFGIYRIRFRVSNNKNAGVKGTWINIQQRNKEHENFFRGLKERAIKTFWPQKAKKDVLALDSKFQLDDPIPDPIQAPIQAPIQVPIMDNLAARDQMDQLDDQLDDLKRNIEEIRRLFESEISSSSTKEVALIDLYKKIYGVKTPEYKSIHEEIMSGSQEKLNSLYQNAVDILAQRVEQRLGAIH